MIDDLQTAVTRSLRIPRWALFGLETVSRERWRVWTSNSDPGASQVQLYLVSLRSQSGEPAFDVQLALSLSWYRPLEETNPPGLLLQVRQLICDYLRSQGVLHPTHGWWSELAAVSCCPWCDSADRLWAVRVEAGPGKQPLPLFVVWLHERLLFLASAWDEALTRLLATARDAKPLSPPCEEEMSSFPG